MGGLRMEKIIFIKVYGKFCLLKLNYIEHFVFILWLFETKGKWRYLKIYPLN